MASMGWGSGATGRTKERESLDGVEMGQNKRGRGAFLARATITRHKARDEPLRQDNFAF